MKSISRFGFALATMILGCFGNSACSVFAGQSGADRSPEATAVAHPIARQLDELRALVRGKRIALVTNPTGVDGQFNPIPDLLHADGQTTITAFFAPEHGLRGDHQAGGGIDDYIDPHTGVWVYSVYGTRRAPTDEQLQGVDILIFDIQDVGVRFYTYVWTMTYAMESAAKNGVKFVVFDRPNPIGLDKMEGAPIPFDGGLVGRVWPGQPFGVPTRQGMTVGEIARLVNGEWMNPKADLQVIPIPGYTRRMTFEQTGYPWVIPSPNMPTLDTARVYPGMCVFEGVNVSEGRGTTRPFELIGAPFVDGYALARDLNALGLPGVRFRAAYITPTFDDYKGQLCGGIQVHMTDQTTFDPIRTALCVLKTLVTLYPDQISVGSYCSTLMGVPNLDDEIRNRSVDEIIGGWQPNLAAFKALSAKYLIYPDAAPAGRSLQAR